MKSLKELKENNQRLLDELKVKNDFDIEKYKLLEDLKKEKEIVKAKIKEDKINNRKKQLDHKRKLFFTKLEIKKDKSEIITGRILYLIALFFATISTMVTIAGGYNDYNSTIFTLSVFVAVIIGLQGGIFLLSAISTVVKNNYGKHSLTIEISKYLLLIISIYNNVKFFNNLNNNMLITFILCLMIDIMGVLLVNLAYDKTKLLHSERNFKPDLFVKELFKVFVIDKVRDNIERKKLDLISKREGKILGDKGSNTIKRKKLELIKPLSGKNYKAKTMKIEGFINTKETVKPLTPSLDKNTVLLKNIIIENKSKKNVCPSVNKLAEITNMTKNQINESKKKLIDCGILETKGTTTYIKGEI